MSGEHERQRERRWVVLTADGRHSTLGRHTDPSEEEVLTAEASLVQLGLGGWIAVAEGAFHVPGRPPRLMEVRRLGQPTGSFDQAAAAFRRLREQEDT